MNYIELIRDFWRSHERHSFGTTEMALYFHLIEICNICNWENPFKRNNAKICADLSISPNTLKNARNKLKQANLIDFESIQGNPNVKYELKKARSSKFDEVRIEVGIEVSNEVGTKLEPTKDKLNKTNINSIFIEGEERFLSDNLFQILGKIESNEEYLFLIARNSGITDMNEVKTYFKVFLVILEMRADNQKTIHEVISHFVNWLRLVLEEQAKKQAKQKQTGGGHSRNQSQPISKVGSMLDIVGELLHPQN